MTTLTVLAWNVYEGSKPADVVRSVRAYARMHKPDVIVLNEALRLSDVLALADYTTFHLPRSREAAARGLHDEATDTAVLIHHDVKIRRHRLLQMAEEWTGPKHGWPHAPKVYPAFLLEARGIVWKFSGGHWPTGSPAGGRNRRAVAETVNRISRWMRHTLPGRPVIHVGDLNRTAREVANLLGGGIKAAGHRIDVAAYKNVELHGFINLGHLVGDHDAILYKFRSSK